MEEKKVCINDGKDDSLIFAFCLAGNAVFINDSNSNSIICRNIEEKKEVIVLSQPVEEFTYYLAHTTPLGVFTAIDEKNDMLIHIEAIAKK